jgi:hypothetical protein
MCWEDMAVPTSSTRREPRMYRSSGALRALFFGSISVPGFVVLGIVKDGVAVGIAGAAMMAIVTWRLWQWGFALASRRFG